MQILVADNNDHTREVLCQTLAAEGFDPLSAESAPDALDLFRKHQPPIVIFDLVLVGMDGLELLQKLKSADFDCEVIATTSFPSLESVVSAMNLGRSITW